jgi:hypothetical protein
MPLETRAGVAILSWSKFGATGFEPLHFRIEIRKDSQPRWQDSNLCIWESDPLHSLSRKAHLTPFVGHPRLLPTRCAPDHFRMEMQRFESSRPSHAVGLCGIVSCACGWLPAFAATTMAPAGRGFR